MKTRLLSSSEGRREWALVMDAGDEAVAELAAFARGNALGAAHFTGIGAFSGLTVAWFDLGARKYRPVRLPEQVEVLSLVGDVARGKDGPSVHAHVCVAKRDATAHGGHLLEARVQPTLEVILVESPSHLVKTFRPEVGLALIDPLKGPAVPAAPSQPKPFK
ncbi:MAG TPA: PPC domain-containing DNA-binding protein [Opitutaceae bacterium]|jgi:hypothetical protein